MNLTDGPSGFRVYESSTGRLHPVDDAIDETWCGYDASYEEGDRGYWDVTGYLARGRHATCRICRAKVTSIARKWRLA